MPATETPMQRLAGATLGEPLRDFVAARRPARSWRLISRDLYEATGGQIDITPESLRNWFSAEAVA